MDTYEKKYKDALERASKLRVQNPFDTVSQMMEYIFPELVESEDEKIKKALIDLVKCNERTGYKLLNNVPTSSMIAWLEKQCDKNKLIKELGEYKVKYTQEVLGQQLEKQCEKKHKFIIGDIISNNNVIYRVDNIVKNCIGQDCYFLVNVESEKDGTRYIKLTDSKGKTHNSGEITWLCEQVDVEFEKQVEQKTSDKVEPKFKVGDIVQYITDSTDRRRIEEVDELCNMYHTDSSPIMFEVEDEWKILVLAENVE